MSVPLGPRRGTCGLLRGRASGRGRGGAGWRAELGKCGDPGTQSGKGPREGSLN